MTDLKVTLITIESDATGDQITNPPPQSSKPSPCPYWAECENPYCFRHGCVAPHGGSGCPAHPNSTHTRIYQ